MKELTVKGLVTVEGMKFHEIEGGFGKDKKSMLVKEIAAIHNQPLGEINRRINDNRKRFKDNVDILDLKVDGFKPLSLELGYTNQSYANSKNIYVLSEKGYAKLLKLLEDDLAWEKYDKLVDGYFNMRKVIKEKTAITEKHLKDMEKRLENKTRMEMETLVGGYQKALVGMQNQMIDFQKQQQDLMMDFMEKVVNKLTNKPTVVNVKKEKYMTISDIIKDSKYKSATAANNILEKHSIVYREYYTEDGKEKFRTLATDSAIALGLALNDPQNGYIRVIYTPKGISTVREILGLDDEQQISFDDPKIVNINR